MTRVVIVAGAGGVGKTTISASLALALADRGHRTLVVTVDPAQRLADALGISELGAQPEPNPEQPDLWAAMLDARGSWESIARRHAPADVSERLIDNEFFVAISRRFPASQSYAAAEEMANFVDAKAWDVIVVDTPPAEGGIGFFTAPARTRDLIGGRLLRWLTGASLPGRRALFKLTGRPALRIADSLLGNDLLERLAEFLLDLRTTYDGMSRRAAAIEQMFRDSAPVIVTTADPGPVTEAARFFRELPEVAAHPRGLIFNRSLPESWAFSHDSPTGPHQATLSANLERWGAEAHRQAEAQREFAARYGIAPLIVPWQPHPPDSHEDLKEMVAAIDVETLLPERGHSRRRLL